jgi:hypothetical protein
VIHRFSAKLGRTALAVAIAREDRRPKIRLLNTRRVLPLLGVQFEETDHRRREHAEQ